jgi:serine phosphatase RsbU (regulator of sigma subunit)
MDKSMSLTLLDHHSGQMKLNANGQHEQVLVLRQGERVERVDTLGLSFPLGLEPGIVRFADEALIDLQPGDGIVLYSEGITEAENGDKEFYGLERLCEVVSAHWVGSAEDVRNAVVRDAREFIGQQTVYNDLALLVIKQR